MIFYKHLTKYYATMKSIKNVFLSMCLFVCLLIYLFMQLLSLCLCIFLPGCMSAKTLQSSPTLCDPVDCSLPGSSVRGSPGKDTGGDCHARRQGLFPTQGWNPSLFMSPALETGLFTTTATWEAHFPTNLAIYTELNSTYPKLMFTLNL